MADGSVPVHTVDQAKIDSIIDEYVAEPGKPLDLMSRPKEGIIIDENNAQEVCERIKAKKVKELILRRNKLRSTGTQIVAKTLIEAPDCELEYLDLGVTFLEIPGVSALSRSLAVNSTIKTLNMNNTNTRRFEVKRLLDGVSNSTSVKKLYLRASDIFTHLDFKPKKADDDMEQVENFLITNRNIDALDISFNEINLEKADRFVEIMETTNYTLKRFDIASTRKHDTSLQQAKIDALCEKNCHLDLVDYETLHSFGTDDLCHYLELLRVNKDCITTVKKSKYTGSDFVALMLEGKKDGDTFVPKIVGPKFDLETATRIRKYFIDHFCAFRLKAGPENPKTGSAPKTFKIKPRSVPPRFEFARYTVDKVIGLLGLVGGERDAVKKFQYDRKQLTGQVFLSLMDSGTLEQELAGQGMPPDAVSHAVMLQDALKKYGVPITRYAYPNVKFDGMDLIFDNNLETETDNMTEAFRKVKDSVDGLPYEKLEKSVESGLRDEGLRKRVASYDLDDDELRSILYLGSFDKNSDNYLLHNINFRLENDSSISGSIHDFMAFVLDALEKLPTYKGFAYFVTPKIVEVETKPGDPIQPSSIIFATKNENDIKAWVDDNPDEYRIFKVKTKTARETSNVCNSFTNEVLLPIDASYTVKKSKGNTIEIEEDDN